jgi:hypothetical protein
MTVPESTLSQMKAAAVHRRLRWWQLSLRSMLALVTLAGGIAFFHEPIGAWAKSTWQRWFPDNSIPIQPPPVLKANACPGCGMG